jgi:hypothetical protein
MIKDWMKHDNFDLFAAKTEGAETPQRKLELPNFKMESATENLEIIFRVSAEQFAKLRETKTAKDPLDPTETALYTVNELAREILSGQYS